MSSVNNGSENPSVRLRRSLAKRPGLASTSYPGGSGRWAEPDLSFRVARARVLPGGATSASLTWPKSSYQAPIPRMVRGKEGDDLADQVGAGVCGAGGRRRGLRLQLGDGTRGSDGDGRYDFTRFAMGQGLDGGAHGGAGGQAVVDEEDCAVLDGGGRAAAAEEPARRKAHAAAGARSCGCAGCSSLLGDYLRLMTWTASRWRGSQFGLADPSLRTSSVEGRFQGAATSQATGIRLGQPRTGLTASNSRHGPSTRHALRRFGMGGLALSRNNSDWLN